jgi:PQQ-dependent catabolism-associated CXXCW motif protein
MTPWSAARAAGGLLLLALFPNIQPDSLYAQDAVPEPPGYQMDDYRGAVPATLSGAAVIDTEAAARLWREKSALFVDVFPRQPRPKLPPGTIFREKPRRSIPGSIWLVDVGYGALTPEMNAYFENGLRQATGGNKAKRLVFFCLANCWMSWNAAKRALSYGYSNVIWYPEGTDGWADFDLPLQLIEPMPRPGESPG